MWAFTSTTQYDLSRRLWPPGHAMRCNVCPPASVSRMQHAVSACHEQKRFLFISGGGFFPLTSHSLFWKPPLHCRKGSCASSSHISPAVGRLGTYDGRDSCCLLGTDLGFGIQVSDLPNSNPTNPLFAFSGKTPPLPSLRSSCYMKQLGQNVLISALFKPFENFNTPGGEESFKFGSLCLY